MRTSKDIWKLQSGELIALSQNEAPPEGATVYSGYDYQKQQWMYEGKVDTRTLAELKASRTQ